MRSLVVHALVRFASAQLVHHNGDYVPASTVTDMCGDIDAMTATVNTECCSEATTGAQGTCHDDAAGSLSASGLTCTAAISMVGNDCAFNMGISGLPGIVTGTLLSDMCPQACGTCSTQHRRAQGDCVLSTCSETCAAAFVGLLDDCEDHLADAEGGFSIISEIPGADDFLVQCENVLYPAGTYDPGTYPADGTRWVPVSSWFGTADPGMAHSNLNHGDGALGWGIWRGDPGPTGVPFSGIPALMESHVAPAGWTLDDNAWWVEEHGRIMTTPTAMPDGQYQLTWLNQREGSTRHVYLTIVGDTWSLDSGDPDVVPTLYDVTHLPCRSAVYTTPDGAPEGSCSPANVPTSQYPVTPGAPMPATPGCDNMDYAVTFITSYWGN